MGFQAACEAYYDAAAALATELMGAVAESLGLSPTTFEAALGANHTSYLRLNWCPPPRALLTPTPPRARGRRLPSPPGLQRRFQPPRKLQREKRR